jgi:DNA ligase-1
MNNSEPDVEAPDVKPGGMSLFANLVYTIGLSAKTTDKMSAIIDYFSLAPDRDKVWVIALFSGRRPKRAVSGSQLQAWCVERTNYPAWLFEECYHTVGDLAETIALLLPEPGMAQNQYLLSFYLEGLIRIEKQDEAVRKKFIYDSWDQLNQSERFVFNKLITGGFRIGVSQAMMVNAIGKKQGIEASVVAHRISGNWDPLTIGWEELLGEDGNRNASRPYPFYLAYALDMELRELGDPEEWFAEWKWDGIRGQVIRRAGQSFIWSRGEELMTEKFPEYQPWMSQLPEGTVLDGEIIGFSSIEQGNIIKPLSFAALQTRIGRKNVTRKQLTEVPVGFIAYDLLESEGQDYRNLALDERKKKLGTIVQLVHYPMLKMSPLIQFESWQQLTGLRRGSREAGAEGIMLKMKDSRYLAGRKRGEWWKWKIDPLVIDAVLVYAQKGHGRRSNLYTDYTFAVRDAGKLVTFTKAYSGLSDSEIEEVDRFVKRNSLEKFGPVRTVKPELVFEIAFEGIAASGRHKSGVALRFPRISRWRKDKKADEAGTLEELQQILRTYGK